jgi:hypothetical protein
LADGIAATDAVTKGQLDASSAAGVSLNTAQTITGEKTFTKEITEKVNMTRGTAPVARMYPKPYKINDSANSMVGNIQFTYGQDMSAGLGMLVYNCSDTTDSTPAVLQVFNVNGTKYATCPTPTEDTTGSIQIDTVGARNTKLGNYVTLGTAQTITGNKTFTGGLVKQANTLDYNGIHIQNTQLSKGTPPSSNAGGQFVFQDKDGYTISDRLGGLEVVYGTNGTIVTRIHACEPVASSSNYASIDVSYPASGSPYATAPSTRSDRTNGKDILTRDWIPLDTRIVHTTGNETIGGVKRFSENILTDINATRNVAPSTTQYGGIGIRDNANNLFASMVAAMDTNKNAAAFLRVFNPSNTSTSDAVYMSLHYNADGSTFVTAPASDVNTSIVTTINKSKAANGYFQLGNGLIINWGTDNGSGSRTIRFSKSFTSTNYKIVGISHGNSYCVVDTSSKTTSTVSVGNSVGFDWIAIGY